MIGGTSHMESFDPKPALTQYAGKTVAETPFGDPNESPLTKKNLREIVPGLHHAHPQIFPLQVGFQKRGQSGIEISDWWPHLGECVDDLAIVRSMWTTDNNHGAQLQFHTGRHSLEGFFPTIGSWAHYGLGSLNDDLPQFVAMGTPIADCCGGVGGHGASYLGPEHNAVQLAIDPKNPLPFAAPGPDVFREEQAGEFELLARLNRLSAVEYPDDPALRARIKSYELAFRMQMAVPEVLRFDDETQRTQQMYGLEQKETANFGQQCLTARRLVERGVRFVQIFHGSNGGAGEWDAHGGLKIGHTRLCKEVDQPIAGLLKDLKQRGLLDETLVVWGTEFGAHARRAELRWPRSSSVWFLGMAGRRWDQAGRRPRRDRRVGFSRGRKPALCNRPARHGAQPVGARPKTLGSARSQTAGNRFRQPHSGNHRLGAKRVWPRFCTQTSGMSTVVIFPFRVSVPPW